jgi:pre-mRNA-processing factor 40
MRAKDAFTKLLSDVLPSIEAFNPMACRFMEVRDSLSKDDRFYAVEDEPTRETLFLEFCEEVRKRDERKRRNTKRDAKDALFIFLREREDSGQLTFASTW